MTWTIFSKPCDDHMIVHSKEGLQPIQFKIVIVRFPLSRVNHVVILCFNSILQKWFEQPVSWKEKYQQPS